VSDGGFLKPGQVKVWEAQTSTEICTLQGHTELVWSVAFSPDGKRIASGSQDQTVRVWDAHSGQTMRTLKGHNGPGWSVAFSPDGKRIASGSGIWDEKKREFTSGEVKEWEVETGKEVLTLKGHSDLVTSLAFSADGTRLASGSDDKTVKLWDAQTGQDVL